VSGPTGRSPWAWLVRCLWRGAAAVTLAFMRLHHATILPSFQRAYRPADRTYDSQASPDVSSLARPEELPAALTAARRVAARHQERTGELPRIVTLAVDADSTETRSRFPVTETALLDGDELLPVTPEMLSAPGVLAERHALLRPVTASVLPIARGCQARCPFCFSASSISAAMPQHALSPAAVARYLDFACRRGAVRGVITGGGEPTLLPLPQLAALAAAMKARFPRVVLITNGLRLARSPELWRLLEAAGVDVVAISRHHHEEHRNTALMGLATHTEQALALARQMRISRPEVRLVCLIQMGGVDSAEELERYLAWADALGIRQLTLKEVYVAAPGGVFYDAAQNRWAEQHRVPIDLVLDFLQRRGAVLAGRLTWGCPVYRLGRMQVAVYWEPTQEWEQQHLICRSYNLLADGRCYASLEDRGSVINYDTANQANSASFPPASAVQSGLPSLNPCPLP
jgi:pyruvate-formate lyase-activating enzyme